MYRLLIVDDEEDIRRGMAKGIPWASWGFEVSGAAENGEEAVRMIGEKKPDVVLTDIRMPKMDGIELMQYLHNNYPEIHIIILSGYSDLEYLNMAIKNQVTEYLLKPTDIDEFEVVFQKIRAQLDEEILRREELEKLREDARRKQELSYAVVLSNMLDGYVGDQQEYQWKEEMEAQGLDFQRCVMVVLDTEMKETEDGDAVYRLKQRIISYLNSREMRWPRQFFLYRGRKIVGILTPVGQESEEAELAWLQKYIENLQSEAGDIYGLALRGGISGICTDERNLPQVYEETQKRLTTQAPDLADGQKKSNILVASIRDYLDREFASNTLSLEFVADHFNRNTAYISKVFKKEG